MLIDYHLHNRFSSDSSQRLDDIAKRALELGISEICITNHVETFPPEDGEGSFSYEEALKRFSEVKKDIEEAKEDYPNLKIKFGIELEYIKEWMPEIKRLVDNMDFDFMIGSIHVVEGNLVSSSEHCKKFYSNLTEEEAYTKYFNTMHELVKWGHFSVVGHFDMCKKGGFYFYDPFDPEKHKDKIIPIIKLMKEKGIGIELNTSGLRYDFKEIFPHPTILKWCKEIGIEHYTISSDAHLTEEVGTNLDKAIDLLKSVGIKTISTYEKGKPTKFDI